MPWQDSLTLGASLSQYNGCKRGGQGWAPNERESTFQPADCGLTPALTFVSTAPYYEPKPNVNRKTN